MKRISIKYIIPLLFLLVSGISLYAQQPLELKSVKRTRFALTSKYDSLVNPATSALIASYRQKMEKQMGEVIGFAPVDMAGGLPESLLLNFSADVMREVATQFTSVRVDMGLMNDGGLRNTIRAGNVTVGNVFEVYPFDNQLVILTLKGNVLRELFVYLAKIGGSGISGARFTISNGLATDIFVGAAALDDERSYTLATIDYLADGNDGMVALKKSIGRKYTGLLLRDAMIDYIRKCTSMSRKIESKVEGRITVVTNK